MYSDVMCKHNFNVIKLKIQKHVITVMKLIHGLQVQVFEAKFVFVDFEIFSMLFKS